MQPALYAVIWIALGFLCGSVPFGYLVARAKGMDIRSVGSGNIGMTNVWRTLGWPYGVTVLVLDALKGWLPVWLLGLCLSQLPIRTNDLVSGVQTLTYLPMLVGIAAILGHTLTPWLKFKGGKGVATGLGVMVALFGAWCTIPLLVFLLVLALTRYVSLGSVLAATTLGILPFSARFIPVPAAWNWPPVEHLWPFSVLACAIVIYTHRENLKRIGNGTERKVGGKATG